MTERDTIAALMACRPNDMPTDLLAGLMTRPAWQREAACRGQGTSAFFPERYGDPRPAKAICATCAVGRQCQDYALVTESTAGIWGGVVAPKIRRRTNAA